MIPLDHGMTLQLGAFKLHLIFLYHRLPFKKNLHGVQPIYLLLWFKIPYVSTEISTLTVYVPDQTHLKLKAKNSTLCLEFSWEDEDNHKIENE